MHSSPRALSPDYALGLGYGGLIPFVVCAAGATLSPLHRALFAHVLFAYGAVILSFIGALHWGFAMAGERFAKPVQNALVLWSVVPALVGVTALLLPSSLATMLLIAGFVLHYAQDLRLARYWSALPAWYLPFRMRVTAIACFCLAVGGLVRHG